MLVDRTESKGNNAYTSHLEQAQTRPNPDAQVDEQLCITFVQFQRHGVPT
jgi:hypothetical protein